MRRSKQATSRGSYNHDHVTIFSGEELDPSCPKYSFLSFSLSKGIFETLIKIIVKSIVLDFNVEIGDQLFLHHITFDLITSCIRIVILVRAKETIVCPSCLVGMIHLNL